MSKILLIKPRLLGNMWATISQPMGLAYIGASLKKAGHEPKIHDCASDYKDLHLLRSTIKKWKPDFIGISIIVTELESTKIIMTLIREIFPYIPVIFGGPWPSANPEEAIKTYGADFVVIGEGELVFPELINAINNKLPTESIAGTASAVDGHVKINHGRQLTEDELNTLPFPAWELLDHKLYAKTFSMANVGNRPYMALVTSRGCPYRCAYCHQTMGKKYRRRSAESVLSEMEELHFKHGFTEFEILDDSFNIDLGRMYAILTGIRDRLKGIKLHFPNGVRTDVLEPEDMILFRQSGTVSVNFAIETSSPRLQKMIHKNLKIEKASHVIDAAVKAEIYSLGFFMMGFPTETYKEASDTINFAVNSKLHRAIFSYPMPFAGTELAKMAEHKIKKHAFEPGEMNYNFSLLNISAMSDSELHKVFLQAYKRFYLSPNRIIRMFIHHPRILSLPRSALTYARVILKERFASMH